MTTNLANHIDGRATEPLDETYLAKIDAGNGQGPRSGPGRLADGARIVGWKIGLTSLAMQQQLAGDQPDFGPILDRWLVPNGSTVSTAELIAPRVEAEIAFILTRLGLSPGPSDVGQA